MSFESSVMLKLVGTRPLGMNYSKLIHMPTYLWGIRGELQL